MAPAASSARPAGSDARPRRSRPGANSGVATPPPQSAVRGSDLSPPADAANNAAAGYERNSTLASASMSLRLLDRAVESVVTALHPGRYVLFRL
jgi:hypothetical protein